VWHKLAAANTRSGIRFFNLHKITFEQNGNIWSERSNEARRQAASGRVDSKEKRKHGGTTH
jgi:hypothetical protein